MIKKKAVAKKVVAKKTVSKLKKFEDGGGVSDKTKRNTKQYTETRTGKSLVGSGSGEYGKGYSKTLTKNDALSAFKHKTPIDGYTMKVTKNGNTNTFNVPKEKYAEQVKIMKKEAGYAKGGTVKKKTVVRKKK